MLSLTVSSLHCCPLLYSHGGHVSALSVIHDTDTTAPLFFISSISIRDKDSSVRRVMIILHVIVAHANCFDNIFYVRHPAISTELQCKMKPLLV